MGWSVLAAQQSTLWPPTLAMKATTLQQALAHLGSVLALESGLMLPSLVSVSLMEVSCMTETMTYTPAILMSTNLSCSSSVVRAVK